MASFSVIPAVEIFLGAWLFFGVWTEVALGAVTVMFASFTLVLVIAVRHGYRGGCACFGTADTKQIGAAHFVRNTILGAGAVFALTQSLMGTCTELVAWELPPTALLMAVIVLAVAAALYILVVEVEDFFRRVAAR